MHLHLGNLYLCTFYLRDEALLTHLSLPEDDLSGANPDGI